MPHAEIVLPITRPETEWIDGEPVQKVSPTRVHGRLSMRIASALDTWSIGRGQTAVEWRFRLEPPGEARRPLVPDIAYVSNARLRGLDVDAAEAPTFAPDVAIEVLSADDQADHVESKTRVYLACETQLVIIVDPRERTIRLVDRENDRVLREPAALRHPALPGFSLDLEALFSAIDLPI
jgi:Uma2 family endonuclease